VSRAKTLLGDPTWYRIGYSLAAQRLHAAMPDEDRVWGENPGGLTGEIIDALRERQGRSREYGRGPVAAEAEALRLLVTTATVLAASGWRWAGRRPSWSARLWARTVRRRRRVADPRLAEFLDAVVEPAAVVLLWSARVEAGHGLERTPEIAGRAYASRPIDRKRLGAAWLVRYLDELLTPEPLPAKRWRRLLGALGFTRFRAARSRGYRVEYNLACLLSRTIVFDGEGDPDPRDQEAANAAASHLQRCFDAVGGPSLEQIASWAWQDPGLANLKRFARSRFETIVGPPPKG
jgi:hypothetical protein